jgi:hypothetical protein
LIYLRPLDLSVDETLHEIQAAVDETSAKRVVIDSLTGLEIALAPTFEQDVRESFYRLIGALTGGGISILMTVEITESYTELRFSPHAVSFMTNDIILQRYVEIDSQLKRAMTVIKTRSRRHPADLRSYEITDRGIVVGERFSEYQGVISGVPQRRGGNPRPAYPGLTGQEDAVFAVLVEMREADERAIAPRTGLQRRVLARALRRLVEVDYASKVVKDDRTVYQPRQTTGKSPSGVET